MRWFNPWVPGVLLVFIGSVLFTCLTVYGVLSKNVAPAAIKKCQELCAYAKKEGLHLANGPCLSGVYTHKWGVPDWACDVAHVPRQPVDDLPENQCKAFREGRARRFVEVDENCNVIRVY